MEKKQKTRRKTGKQKHREEEKKKKTNLAKTGERFPKSVPRYVETLKNCSGTTAIGSAPLICTL